MPELPEVEVAARNLRQWMVGEVVAGVEAPDEKVLAAGTGAEWEAALCGRRCLGVARRAKYLLMDFEGGHTVVAHLRMTGKFVLVPAGESEPAYVRFRFLLTDGRRVLFRDMRRFGRAWLLPTAAVAAMPELAKLGPDAYLEPLGPRELAERARRSRRPVKTWLMDQTVIGGLGNICASEILFRARIAPERPADSLADEEIERLAAAIPDYLEWAIRAQSGPEIIYIAERRDANPFAIYGHGGEPCPRCGAALARKVIAGRSTFSCPVCQAPS
ncbi:MAG: bifunctional DNA-formamidopyrimidine glycosylase/DNA-(apurinic or apyrimidinic site) lyase [Armatimonadetes bacterium]|nr:bifunctional DNA-formamidopyrimidine glycosylase/DNA-(apurinic or apyrimidinic site) lyase [Armatimonadota bacterium]